MANQGRRPAPPGFLTKKDLADRWGLCLRTVASYLSGKRPKLPSVLIANRRLIRVADVEAYEHIQTNGKGKLGPAGVCNLQKRAS